MSDDEGFLARWSRRKREGAAPDDVLAEQPPTADAAPPEQDEPVFDLTQLPPIDAIDAATDIRAFLTRGVPAALTNAALRRAWATDPAIRDFVAPAENAWDFTAPGGVPGFGPMIPEADSVATLARTAGQGGSNLTLQGDAPPTESPTASRATVSESPAEAEVCEVNSHTVVNNDRAADEQPDATVIVGCDRIADKQQQDVASREANSATEPGTAFPRRRHGGAVPG